MIRYSLIAIALAACVHSNKVVCGDLTCPPDYTCDAANMRCLSPDQVAACGGHNDGDACLASGAPGTCSGGGCVPFVCGDGLVTGAEQCDGSNFGGATCRDYHFYDDGGLVCTASCTVDISACTGYCGDGVVNGGELCDGSPPAVAGCFDFGYDAGPVGCSSACGASFDTCGRIGWKIEPTDAQNLVAVAASAHDDGWAVGNMGAIVHFNGVVWAQETSPVMRDLVAVAAIAPGDAWAVGTASLVGNPGVVLRRDTSQWQVVTGAPTAVYNDVWATAHDHVFFATDDHGVIAWDGTSFQALGTLGAAVKIVRGTSSSDLWAVLGDGSVQRWNGASWTLSGPTGQVIGLSAVGPSDVWAVGFGPAFSGLIAHWDGSSWTSSLDPANQYTGVAASGPKDVWVTQTGGTALHYDGATWSDVTIAVDRATVVITSLGPDEAFGVELDGFAYRYTGQANAEYGLPTFGPAIQAMWSSSGTDIYVGEGNKVYRNGPTGFTSVLTASAGVTGLAGSSAANIWAVAIDGSLYHFDTAWQPVTAPAGLQAQLWVGATDVWTFSMGAAHHGPPPFTDYPVPAALSWVSVSGEAPNDIWAVIDDSSTAGRALVRWNGSTWNTVSFPRTDPTAVGVRASDDVWVATKAQRMLHWDGTSWSSTTISALHPLHWLISNAADDVFAAGDWDLFHYDGTRWSRIRPDIDTTQNGNEIAAVTSPGPAHFQYVHAQGTVRDLLRTKPWVCRATETNCNDSIDDDCDGKIDHDDSDCP